MDANARPVVVFGRLAGLGVLSFGVAGLIAAGGFFMRVANEAHDQQLSRLAEPQEVMRHDFQLVQLGEFRRDQFLVDKSTGRVWQSVCTGPASGADCNGMLIWDEMYVDGVTPSESSVAAIYLQHINSKP